MPSSVDAFTAGSVVGALAGSIPTLIAGRAIQGLGAAFVLPATLSIVTNAFPRGEREKAIAVWTAVGGMGIGFGPAIGGYLVVNESRDEREVGIDVPGAITATLGISALAFGVIQGTEAGWTSPLIIGSFAVAAAFLASVTIIGLMFFAGPATFFFMTQFFQIVQGRDAFEAGLLILPNAGAIVAASALAPRFGRTLGLRWTVTVSVAIMGIAMAIFTQIDPTWTAGIEIAVIMLFGFGFGLGMPSLTDSIMASVPVEDAGVGSAVNDVSRELGSALGIAILGTFINSLYRSNVEEALTGQVSEDLIETAQEGIGVVAATAPSLPPEIAQSTFAAASDSFVQAMNSGFWLGTGVMVVAALIAVTLLPRTARSAQVERTEDDQLLSEPVLVA